ncbi:MAG: ribonuclease J [Caldilineaceae bacterium]
MEQTSNQQTQAPLLRVVPLGGLGEIGKNMMVLEAEGKLLVIDVGLMFPSSDMLGIDVVIPDAEYVLERLDDVVGIILTHGHEDHIGALPYLMEEGLTAPTYATALTRGLLESKLSEHKLLGHAQLHTITSDDKLDLSPFEVEFFHTCHSFPDSVGVSVKTPAGRVIHTSDYKLDPTPNDNKPTEVDKLQRWGEEGVLLLMADSTNVEEKNSTPSEKMVEKTLDTAIGAAQGRVILTTFASNVGRVKQVMNVAHRHGRRVGVTGRSMVNNVKTAIKLGYLDITESDLLSPSEMETLPPSQVVIVATGSQGEPTSAMVRMSMGEHRQITLREGDTVVLSAAPIPGNEEYFNRTVDNLFRQGVDVLYHELGDVHVSGHGGQEDYRHILEIVHPQHFIPVHGEYRHLVLHGRLAATVDLDPSTIFVIEDGQTVEFFPEDERVVGKLGYRLPVSQVLVDGSGVGDIGNIVLRDRRHLGQDGFIVCIVALDEYDGEVIFGPEIISRGFVYMRENEDLIRRAEDAVEKVLKKQTPRRVLEGKVKDALSVFCQRELDRRPMVIPVVLEV